MASQVAKPDSEKTDIERELEADLLGTPNDDEMLATMSERQEHRFQMQEIKRRTVEPGVMKLSVANIQTAENSPQWAIDLEHPAQSDSDEIRIFAEKPMDGWSDDYKIVKLLEWYDISSQDPHQLEYCDLYVEKNESESDYSHGWQVTEPPAYKPPGLRRAKRAWNNIAREFRPDRTIARMWGTMVATTVGTAMIAMSQLYGQSALLSGLTVFGGLLIGTILGLAVMPHE